MSFKSPLWKTAIKLCSIKQWSLKLRSQKLWQTEHIIIILCVMCSVLPCSCKKEFVPQEQTPQQFINLHNQMNKNLPPVIYTPQIEQELPKHARVWAGTVSHHEIAHQQIDFWFSNLASKRKVETFFIISPSHYGLSSQKWSLADYAWQTENGTVFTDSKIEQILAQTLEVSYDPQVFPVEHGINVLIPYIARYFPNATVCAVAVYGEPPLNQKDAGQLVNALSPFFTGRNKNKNFLLISTDFSHHDNIENTLSKDIISREFFTEPTNSSWIFCGCDNRPGIYVLAQLMDKKTRSSLLYCTNSFELTGLNKDDLTSYFFSYFYQK